jgi:hypothetical protein
MKTPLLFVAGLLVASLAPATTIAAPAANVLAAVTAADDERVAATQAGDRARLAASYSDDLHYAHSNGRIDNKTSQLDGVIDGPTIYENFEYKDRVFVPAGPGIVLMRGRVLVQMKSKTTGEKSVNDLNYLAVWREENGKWRFLAWQSCKNLPTAAAPAKR